MKNLYVAAIRDGGCSPPAIPFDDRIYLWSLGDRSAPDLARAMTRGKASSILDDKILRYSSPVGAS